MARPVGTPTAARRRPWRRLIFLALLVVPVVEIAVIIAVGKVIGGWPTVALLLLESLAGAWLVRREGARTWRALNTALSTGAMPSRELADAALVLIGGTLLLTPGFVTDIVGFFFILPFTRPIARRLLESAVRSRLLAGSLVVQNGAMPRARPGAWPGQSTGPMPGPNPDASPGRGQTVEGEVVDR